MDEPTGPYYVTLLRDARDYVRAKGDNPDLASRLGWAITTERERYERDKAALANGVPEVPRGQPVALARWGKAEPGTDLLLQRRADGYWTEWHIAQAALDAARGVAPTDEAEPQVPVAYEFLHPNGHAIVDYTEHTHVGHLTREKGYTKRPLIYGDSEGGNV